MKSWTEEKICFLFYSQRIHSVFLRFRSIIVNSMLARSFFLHVSYAVRPFEDVLFLGFVYDVPQPPPEPEPESESDSDADSEIGEVNFGLGLVL